MATFVDDGDYVLVDWPEDSSLTGASDSNPEHLSTISDFIDELGDELWSLNDFIHTHPELGYHEYKAHDALTSFFRRRKGWSVTTSAYGLETAWEATFDTGRRGPVIAFNAEMDALPNLGHACGHNLIAVASVAAGLASAEILRSNKIGGKVRVIGTPAEEGGGGKIKLLAAGAYKGVDVSIISHPGIYNNSAMVRTTAFTHLKITYHGHASHAANAPWKGINALDALVIAYNAVSALRQQTYPGDVIGLQITDGGNKPNIIHQRAAGVATLRSTRASQLDELQRKVEACFRAGAEATGATVDIEVIPGYKDHMPNLVLAESYAKYWLALPNVPEPKLPYPGQFTLVKSSTDQGNISYTLPSMNVSFTIPPGVERGPPHSPDFEKASSTRAAFDSAMRVAKAMAGTAVDVYTIPGLLQKVKKQWEQDVAA